MKEKKKRRELRVVCKKKSFRQNVTLKCVKAISDA